MEYRNIFAVLMCLLSVSEEQNLRLRNALLADFRLNDLDNDNIPGTAGIHYPVLSSVPQGTSFQCKDYDFAGYFADVEADCQAYHVCFPDGRNASFLCVNGTIFHQRYFVCDWWFHFNCSHAPSLYDLNLFRKIPLPVLPPVQRRPYMPPVPEPRVAFVQAGNPENPETEKKKMTTSPPAKEKTKPSPKPVRSRQAAKKQRNNPIEVTKTEKECDCTCDRQQDFRNKFLLVDL